MFTFPTHVRVCVAIWWSAVCSMCWNVMMLMSLCSELPGSGTMITSRHDEIRYTSLSKMRYSQLVYIIHLATGNCAWERDWPREDGSLRQSTLPLELRRLLTICAPFTILCSGQARTILIINENWTVSSGYGDLRQFNPLLTPPMFLTDHL